MNDVDISTAWIIVIVAVAIWELLWKAIALWKAASNKQTGWFVVLLLLNTAGILPLIYIFVVDKDRS